MSVPDPVGRWVPDPLAPSGFRWQRYDEPALTQIQPVVPARTVRYDEHEDHVLEPAGPEHPGGDWANADAYLSYDDVDSRTVIDTGAP